MKLSRLFSLVVGVFFALVVLVIAVSSFVTVNAGERGVVLNWGAFNGQILQPGLHFIMPIAQSVVVVNVQTNKLEIEKSDAYSHDLQNVLIHSALNYSINPDAVGLIYQNVGTDVEGKIINPNLEAAVKQVIAKYSAETILSDRATVQSEIEDTVRSAIASSAAAFDPSAIIVSKYSMVDETFSDAYEQAIEQKQVAQQQAEKAKNDLLRAQIDASSTIVAAQAQAEAIKIQSEAVQAQGGQSYVDLQAIKQWDGHLPNQMIPGQVLPFINLTK